MKNTAAESTRTTLVFSQVCYIKILRRVIDLARYNCIIWDWNGTLLDDLKSV